MAEVLHFPAEDAAKLEPYLPPRSMASSSSASAAPAASAALHGDRQRPFVTLTFATSLDSSLALAPGVRTALSGPQSKAMTHYLRSRHDAILIGVGTAVADDPGLNCRIASDHAVAGSGSSRSHPIVSTHQPRPIVVDPQDRWPLSYDSRVLATQRRGLGLAPFVVTAVREPDAAKRQLLEDHGGKYITLGADGDAANRAKPARFRWEDLLASVAAHGLGSIMIEGGGSIINTLLDPRNSSLVDSVIVTIAPTWLGRGGVVVSPDPVYDTNNQATAAARLTDVKWQQLGDDVILCGRLNS